MRQTLIAGNWKMHKLPSDAAGWIGELEQRLRGTAEPECELLLCVPATHLPLMSGEGGKRRVALGGQDLSPHDEGAYTGEISGAMLGDAGASYVVVGHSERRAYHGEHDELVNRKVVAARRNRLVPILCVGETEEQRDSGEAQAVVLRQLELGLQGVDIASPRELVVAYEPVWAIGTGRTATSEDAQQMCGAIRSALSRLYPSQSDSLRILYGGSMKPGNAAELLAQNDIDGGLVGGASLVIDDFLAIATAS